MRRKTEEATKEKKCLPGGARSPRSGSAVSEKRGDASLDLHTVECCALACDLTRGCNFTGIVGLKHRMKVTELGVKICVINQ